MHFKKNNELLAFLNSLVVLKSIAGGLQLCKLRAMMSKWCFYIHAIYCDVL